MQYDNEGKIALWRSDSENPKGPTLTGTLKIDGVSYAVSIWDGQSENPRAPILEGKVKKRTEITQPAKKAAGS